MENDYKTTIFVAENHLSDSETLSVYQLFFGVDGVKDLACYQNSIELTYNPMVISSIEMFQFIIDLGINSYKGNKSELLEDQFNIDFSDFRFNVY
ncbi:hypothetical protein [Marinifilum sp.]|uniref:hypothetical protein n=1 Tax=Marinifilum sp. TaxID=2033137 RepID=UPI003BAC6874